MTEIAIMLEAQNGLNWPRFQRIARAVEDLGFAGLYRSDHVTNMNPPDLDSLELWVSLTWLATHTTRIEFGPLVSPVSFRDPVMTARMAAAVDDLSGGRLHLGLGAGWQEREHRLFGWNLLSLPERFHRLRDGLEVVTRLLGSDEPVSYTGKYAYLEEATLLPRPLRPGGPPILIGGNGPRYTLPLVAQYAAIWNGFSITPDKLTRLNAQLDELLAAHGRRPQEVKRTAMIGLTFGRDETELRAKLKGRSPDELRGRGVIVGTPGAVVEQVGTLAEAGASRIMLQWLDLDDLDGLEALASAVLVPG